MLTASHNPPTYHGIKFIPEYAAPAMPDITNQITEEVYTILETKKINKIEDLEAAKKENMLEIFSPKENYIDHVLKLVDLKGLKESASLDVSQSFNWLLTLLIFGAITDPINKIIIPTTIPFFLIPLLPQTYKFYNFVI